jgi:N-acetylmuramoyl-L-alanine amidase
LSNPANKHGTEKLELDAVQSVTYAPKHDILDELAMQAVHSSKPSVLDELAAYLSEPKALDKPILKNEKPAKAEIKKPAYVSDKNDSETRIVILDPGHGMGNRKKGRYDPGCVYSGFKESELVMKCASEVEKRLSEKKFENQMIDFAVKCARYDEKTETPLETRANYSNADAFVSLHMNAAKDAKASGVRVFYLDGNEEGRKLAKSVYDSLTEILEKEVSGYKSGKDEIRKEDFRVLKEAKNIPAVLVELGFLSNAEDIKYLTEKQDIVARGVKNGIVNYFYDRMIEEKKNEFKIPEFGRGLK